MAMRTKGSPQAKYLRALAGRGCAQHTLASYERWLSDARAQIGRGPRHWSGEDISDWLGYLRLERGNGPKTLACKLGAVRGLCAWMVDAGIRPDDPCAAVRSVSLPRRLPRPAPERAVAALLAHSDPTVVAAVALGCYAGLRRAEMCGLRWSDITPEGIYVIVGAKGGHPRLVPVSEPLRRVLAAHERRGVTVLADRLGRRYTPDGLGNRVRPAMRDAGLPAGQSLHTLRHYFATHAVAAAPINAVASVLGHQSLNTTQAYAAVAEPSRRAAVDWAAS